MLSLGACKAFEKPRPTFYAELKPLNKNHERGAMRVNGLSLVQLAKAGLEPVVAMRRFDRWCKRVSGKDKPFFVAFPGYFDWSFVTWYFHTFLGHNPFESRRPFQKRVIEMKSFFAGKAGLPIERATRDELFRRFPPTVGHTHNAVDDAIGYAEVFEQLYARP